MTVAEILDQLDSCARNFTFPMLDNGYIYLGTTRLSCFRDPARWIIAIEVVGANHRAGGHNAIQNCIHLFGNSLRRPPGMANEDFLNPTADSQESPTFAGDFSVDINPQARTIQVRDRVVPIPADAAAVEALGITLAEPPTVTAADVRRALVVNCRDSLLATAPEIAARIPNDLPTFLVLEEWCHPDLAGGQLPSQSEAFQLLAKAMVVGDPATYRPTEPPNTHWSHWPDAGSL